MKKKEAPSRSGEAMSRKEKVQQVIEMRKKINYMKQLHVKSFGDKKKKKKKKQILLEATLKNDDNIGIEKEEKEEKEEKDEKEEKEKRNKRRIERYIVTRIVEVTCYAIVYEYTSKVLYSIKYTVYSKHIYTYTHIHIYTYTVSIVRRTESGAEVGFLHFIGEVLNEHCLQLLLVRTRRAAL